MAKISWASGLNPEAALLAGVLAAAEAALPGKSLDLLVWGASSSGDQTTLCYLLDKGGKTTWTPSKQGVVDIPDVPSTSSGHVGVLSVLDADETSCAAPSDSVAAAKGNAAGSAVDVSLKAEVDVDTVDNYGATPLLVAVKKGHQGVVEKLLNAGADVDQASTEMGTTPLIAAVLHGNTAIVQLLLDSGADVNKERKNDGSTPVLLASLKGLEEVVNQLIQAGADVTKASKPDGTTPLHMAAGKGNERIVESLLRCGADPNTARTTDDGFTALSVAALNGNERVVQLLIKAGARIVTESGESALTLAAWEGHIDACSLLLKAGADVDHESRMTGQTPLNEAVRHDQRETALFLLRNYGASCSAGIVDKPARQTLAKWVVQEMMNAETIEEWKHQRGNLQRRNTSPNVAATLQRRREFFFVS